MRRTYDHELLLMDPIRVMSFEPDAVKDALASRYGEGSSEEAECTFFETLDENDFRQIGDDAIDCGALWDLFHELIEMGFRDLYDRRHK